MDDANASIGVGIVGLSSEGGWAGRAHVPALRALDGYELRGLAASSEASARRSAEHFGVERAYGDAAALARDETIDLVAICVRVPAHLELVRACLDAGTAVYCEWPLTRDVAEARELAALSAATGVRVAVGLQARSTPTIRYLHDLIAAGEIGEVLSSTLVGSGGNWGGEVAPRNDYILDAANGATMTAIPFGHTLDAVVHVLGGLGDVAATTAIVRPQAVDSASGARLPKTAADQLALSATLRSGAVLSAHYRGGLSRGTNFHWEINGSDGDVVLRGPTGHLQFGRAELLLAPRGGGELASVEIPAEYRLVPPQLTGDGATVGHAYALLRQDVERGTRVVPDVDHALAHHELLAAIERSAREGVRVTL